MFSLPYSLTTFSNDLVPAACQVMFIKIKVLRLSIISRDMRRITTISESY
jgi:hypothetical protein